MHFRHATPGLALCILTTVSGCSGDAPEHTPSTAEAAAPFFLPTGEPDNTSAPTLEVDAEGATHAVYPAYAGGGAYYAYCGPGCRDAASTQVVRFPTDGTAYNAMLALDRDGHPRVLLSSFRNMYYAWCDADCGVASSWSQQSLLTHDLDREVSGEAFALDVEGRPRFLMHTQRAYLGIGQKDPATFLVRCDADCGDPARWSQHRIADAIWQGSHLRYTADGVAKVATSMELELEGRRRTMAAYLECASDCDTERGWSGIALGDTYASELEAISVAPTVSLALTGDGAPRVAYLGVDETGAKRLVYMSCDTRCGEDNWQGVVLSNHTSLGAGLDLALDAADKPRVVYTESYAIGLWSCDAADCVQGEPSWDLRKVEGGDDMPPDRIFPYPNCTVGAWFLHGPSIALTPDGAPRVGYQARDVSGGWNTPAPGTSACQAGTDMTFSRLALLGATVR